MSQNRLDQRLLKKLANKTNKNIDYVRQQISKRAAKRAISAEAAEVLWAKEYGIGTAHYQRSLPAHLQDQVRDNLTGTRTKLSILSASNKREVPATRPRVENLLRPTIDYLLSDVELRKRCADLLRAQGSFDRVFREATTVLDHRLKTLGNIKTRMNPVDLVGKVLNSNPSKAILVVSEDGDQQEGVFSLCKGIFLAFRNPAHHHLSDKVTREDALRFCGFVNLILSVLGQARLNSAP